RHQVVLGRVDPDAVEPSIKGTVAAECGERAVGLDERFLRHVLDLRRVADEPREQPRQLALVLLHQQLERALVAALRPLNQLQADLAVRHESRLAAPGGSPHPRTQRPMLYVYLPQTHAVCNTSTPSRVVSCARSCYVATAGNFHHNAQMHRRRNNWTGSMALVTRI